MSGAAPAESSTGALSAKATLFVSTQAPYLPVGGRDVSAIVTVTADDTGDAPPAAPSGGAAEIIIIDCSGSMDYPPTKMTQARAATAAPASTAQ